MICEVKLFVNDYQGIDYQLVCEELSITTGWNKTILEAQKEFEAEILFQEQMRQED